MAIQRWSKLARVMFTPPGLAAHQGHRWQYVGLSLGERYGSMLSGLFRGAADSDKRVAAELTLAGADARLGHMVSRYDVADQAPGKMAKIDQVFFKLTGVNAATENQRPTSRPSWRAISDAARQGVRGGRPYEKRALSLYGIGEPEWKALHTVDWSDIGDKRYLMPPDARKLEDDAVRTMLRERGGIGSRSITDESIRKAREDLADSLHAMLYDQGRYAIFAPSAKTRAILFQGAQQSAPNLYKAMQLLFQFKIWPAEMFFKPGATDQRRRRQPAEGRQCGRVGGASAAFGVLSEALRETIQGQDPRAG